MEVNASNAGVKAGGLVNQAEIKILICYLFSSVTVPICGRDLAELLFHEGIANYFEVDNGISELVKTGMLTLINGETDKYVITDKGKETSATLKTTLPFTVRQKAYAATVKMLAAARNYEETKFEIEPREKGCIISCSAYDRNSELLTVRIAVADEQQAQTVKNRFVKNPAAVCRKIIDFVLEEEK